MKNKIKETYSVKVFCSNCSYGHTIASRLEIEKGQTVDFIIQSTVCPVCGCYKLVKEL